MATPPPDLLRAVAALLARRGGEVEALVHGGSMGRTLPAGTPIRLRWVRGGDCREGQIVAFLAGRTLVTHRVVARGRRPSRRGFLVTCGDGTWLCDPPVAEDLVVGIVAEWNDGAGWRPAADLRAPNPGRGATMFRDAVVTALDLHLWAARALFVCASVLRRLASRRAAPTP